MADVVLVHGITESKHSWDPLIAPLSAEHRVLAVDLRGHGGATRVPPFDLAVMVGDLVGDMSAAGFMPAESVLIGHSLGGMVASAFAASVPCRGVINVDQPLKLAEFQGGLQQLEPLLRGDQAAFDSAIAMVFSSMVGPLPAGELARIDACRRGDQNVVLGVWDAVLTSTPAELDALVESVVGSIDVPYLSLHGIDPGDAYEQWLSTVLPQAFFEVWPDHGHYPHLVEPQRFVTRVNEFVAAL
jgi:pimeloyl-ACP methyl ester carboxylesterase